MRVSKKEQAIAWLYKRLTNQENGIILDDLNSNSFEWVQSFVEERDLLLKTTVIYYEAFAGETTAEFLATLRYELASKLGKGQSYTSEPISEILAAAQLRMIIFDRSYLCPLDTLHDLLDFCAEFNISIILMGTYCNLKIAQIIDHPNVKHWDKFIVDGECEHLSATCLDRCSW